MGNKHVLDDVPLIKAGKTQHIIIDAIEKNLYTVGRRPDDDPEDFFCIGSTKFPLRKEDITKLESRYFEQQKPVLEALLHETSELKQVEQIKINAEANALLQFILNYVIQEGESRQISGAARAELTKSAVFALFLMFGGILGSPYVLKELQKSAGVTESEPKYKKPKLHSRAVLDAMGSQQRRTIIDDLLKLNRADLVQKLCTFDESTFPLIPKLVHSRILISGGMGSNPRVWELVNYKGTNIYVKISGNNFSLAPLYYADSLFENYGSLIEDEIERKRDIIKGLAERLKSSSTEASIEKIVKEQRKEPKSFRDVGFFINGDRATVYVYVPPTIIMTTDGFYMPVPQKIESGKFQADYNPPQNIKLGVDLAILDGVPKFGWPRVLEPHTADKYKFSGQYKDSTLCAPELQKIYTQTYAPKNVCSFLFDARVTLLIGWPKQGDSGYGFDTPPIHFQVITKADADELIKQKKYKTYKTHKLDRRTGFLVDS